MTFSHFFWDLQTYAKRDVQALIGLKRLRLFQHFLILLRREKNDGEEYSSGKLTFREHRGSFDHRISAMDCPPGFPLTSGKIWNTIPNMQQRSSKLLPRPPLVNQVLQCTDLLDMIFLDHLIIGRGNRYYSYAEDDKL